MIVIIKNRLFLQLLSLILIFFYLEGCLFSNQRKIKILSSFSTFSNSIQIEKRLSTQITKGYYNPALSPNKNITRKEKEEWIWQHHFIRKDPNRTHLDSIFNAELTKEGILGKGVIYCSYRNKETCSSPDTLFKKNAIPLEPIVFRINEKEENNIILQAYVQISFWGILFLTTEVYFLFFIWIFLIIGIIYKNKKAKEKDIAIKIKIKRLDELRIQEEQK